MSTVAAPPSSVEPPRAPPRNRAIPPLVDGQRLSGVEFMRRYENMPEIKKAELVEGLVHIMASPVRYDVHGNPHSLMQTCVGFYAVMMGLGHADNTTIYLSESDIYQPDGALFKHRRDGGDVLMNEKGYLEGAPELIVEVCASTTPADLGKKKDIYLRSGVAEYIAWCTEEIAFNWWMIENGVYVPLPADADGIRRSRIFPGFWLHEKALLAGDGMRVLAVLQEGIKSVSRSA